MKTTTFILLLFSIVTVLFLVNTSRPKRETFDTMENEEGETERSNCPNLLVKKGDKYFLYNTTKIEVPGVNPVQFNELSDYTTFMEWLRNQGIRCPVLYLQQTNDTQGSMTYKMLPSPYHPNLGLPPADPTKLVDAGHDSGSYPSFDPKNQYIGKKTYLDTLPLKERPDSLLQPRL